MEAGKPHGIRPTGPSDIRRIEAGILNWGADITLADTPYHVGLEWLVDRRKTSDYMGRAALERVAQAGVDRRLVGVEIDGDVLPFNTTKWPVSLAGDTVGRITSAIWSPRLEKNLGYAMVPVACTAMGSRFTVTLDDGDTRSATVVAKPFMDPQKDIPKS